ncbi:DNA primase family protein [Amaricoccus solimangrovi]|uniref:SF3 helicase domain-containing protein n=1 Tax=Amaricoccus solimangrovi TaxID=2589815 RepID=A0A501WS90_9RHOB|nr:phage/plasmid primase, P4 family [Amaricoccus solimangrovi]TPE52603.1 hypothetical protein FJM51_05340 [Amaricoccus solimangrovi]
MSLISELMGLPPDGEPAPAFVAGDENDRWNADRLAAAHGERMIFVGGKGWGIWDGARFDFSDGDLRAAAIAEELQALVNADAEKAWRADFDEIAIARRMAIQPSSNAPRVKDPAEALKALRAEGWLALRKHAVKCGNVDKMEKALKVLRHRLRVAIDTLDADPWSFTVPNGRIDLRAAAYADLQPELGRAALVEARARWLKPHDRESLPTKCAGVEYDPAADCPEWRAFLELVLPDPEVRACFHRSMGATLFGRNEPQCAFLFRGSGGNGKSTAVNMIAHVLGESGGYAVPCKIELFLATANESAGKATPEEVDIPGARALIASEPDPTDELSAKRIKALTGGDPRPARGLNQGQFYYRPTAFPILSFNRTPRIKNEDEGTRRRLVFIPFEVNLRALPEDRRRSPIEVERALKAEGPGVLNWMLEGWRAYRERADAGIGAPPGIDPPEAMRALKDSLLEHADPIGEFIKDCCRSDAAGPGIRSSAFFRVYSEWCDWRDVPPRGRERRRGCRAGRPRQPPPGLTPPGLARPAPARGGGDLRARGRDRDGRRNLGRLRGGASRRRPRLGRGAPVRRADLGREAPRARGGDRARLRPRHPRGRFDRDPRPDPRDRGRWPLAAAHSRRARPQAVARAGSGAERRRAGGFRSHGAGLAGRGFNARRTKPLTTSRGGCTYAAWS